ncbi:lytic transglycosylase domain-containing protein [Roseicitreum antarcticum]|uniref:Soluble lytic murein transglycosylase n=1 Tax=Roseicitreum antarcticum TaxID=564137 RepID=A0A1H2R0Q1_9RHOB|nr:lytic transglycosylase domain-containing protein [Roseicitreum antarcticum]SDW13046.1 soluble lytic murein transglycosylase [Roseicitreum antarcticum]
MPLRQTISVAISAFFVLGVLLTTAEAQDTAPPSRAAGLLSAAWAVGQSGDWSAAQAMADPSEPITGTLITWRQLRAGEGTPGEAVAFTNAHPHWPLTETILQQGERNLTDATPSQVLAFFADRTPATDIGAMALIASQTASDAHDAAQAGAIRLWRGASLSAEQEALLLDAFPDALTPLHAERLTRLLWDGNREAAGRMLNRVSSGQSRLAQARIGLQTGADGVNALIDAVPPDLADAPGLAFDRFNWRMTRQIHDTATDLIRAQSVSADALGEPQAWARWRIYLVREAIADGDHALAYELAANHHLTDGVQFADLEWLAGFIALRDLDMPAEALRHFRNLRVRVSSPISLGRAGYWEGRAHEALGQAETARAAYAFGAEHQTSYYGQIAAERIGLPMSDALVAGPDYPDWRETALAQSDLLAAALILRDAGEWFEARRFVMHLAAQLESEAELGSLSDLMLALNEPNFAVNIAKIAVQRDIILPRAYFPLTDLARADLSAPIELVKAIARRESEFDAAVVSRADARGLMQVLPGTGQMMAQRIGLSDFDAGQLTANPGLNARLGAAYLTELTEEFGPSLALVAAGYNAGPGRPRQWIEELGDPRDPSVDIIDWVESVPFAETRNYIMRVAESLVVYRTRLAGEPAPIAMEELLRGR